MGAGQPSPFAIIMLSDEMREQCIDPEARDCLEESLRTRMQADQRGAGSLRTHLHGRDCGGALDHRQRPDDADPQDPARSAGRAATSGWWRSGERRSGRSFGNRLPKLPASRYVASVTAENSVPR